MVATFIQFGNGQILIENALHSLAGGSLNMTHICNKSEKLSYITRDMEM